MQECLEAHNRHRKLHGVDPLEIEKQLNELAQKRANSLAETGFTAQVAGENIYVTGSADSGIRIKDIVDSWCREGKYYKYGAEQPRKPGDVCHFTQVVWKDTKTMGVGLASDMIGNVYLVCTYQPAGNVEGMYADNVLKPIEASVTELPLEETGIIYDEPPKPECVKSMERLYAVPSEELRVWSAWMIQVGVVAAEWQKWLQENIDRVLVLNRRLVNAKYDIASEEEADEMNKAVGSEESYVTAEGDSEMPAPIEEFIRAERTREKMAMASQGTLLATKSIERMSKVKSVTSVVSNASEGQPKSMTSIASRFAWPLGSPWTPLGIREEEATVETTRQVPRIPRNGDEMKEYMKEFTHQATLYRSYYKHWLETAEQATKEIGCRTVMPTWQVQGIDIQKGRGKSSDTTYMSAQSLVDPSAKPSETEEEFQDALENPEETAENEEKISRKSAMSGKAKTKNVSISEKALERTSALGSPKSAVSLTPSKSAKSVESVESSKSTMLRTHVTITETMKESARADEDIPYFFYLKSLPDIEIAIEHDDEEVIDADPDRERIIGNYKQLFFNLCDKPGKDGKPWI